MSIPVNTFIMTPNTPKVGPIPRINTAFGAPLTMVNPAMSTSAPVPEFVRAETLISFGTAAVNEVLKQNQRVLKDPAPVVIVSLLAGSSIHIAVRPWVNVPDYGPANGDINKAIVEGFRARNISIPLPQREVRLLNPPAAPKP